MASPALPVRYATLVYGEDPAMYRRAAMMFVSLAAYAPAPAELVLMTDRPGHAAWLLPAVRIEAVESAAITAWAGDKPFSMRQKIEAARRLLPAGGALVLLDADVLAIAPLDPLVERLATGALFLHKREYELGTSRRRGNRRLWADLQAAAVAWEFRAADAMWNSGIIALTDRDAALLDSARELYDALGSAGVRHFMIEQLAVGAVFERTGRLLPADRFFVHYWGNKAGFDREIEKRLDEARTSGMSLPEAAARFRAHPITLPAEVRPRFVDKLTAWLSR